MSFIMSDSGQAKSAHRIRAYVTSNFTTGADGEWIPIPFDAVSSHEEQLGLTLIAGGSFQASSYDELIAIGHAKVAPFIGTSIETRIVRMRWDASANAGLGGYVDYVYDTDTSPANTSGPETRDYSTEMTVDAHTGGGPPVYDRVRIDIRSVGAAGVTIYGGDGITSVDLRTK